MCEATHLIKLDPQCGWTGWAAAHQALELILYCDMSPE